MSRRRLAIMIALSTVLSTALGAVVNIATGALPGPLASYQWLAWPLAGLLLVVAVVVTIWQTVHDPTGSDPATAAVRVTPAELPAHIQNFDLHTAELVALVRKVPKKPSTGVGAPVVLAISGPPGVGKSRFAVRLAHQVAGRYVDGQLFVRLRGATAEPANPAETQRRLLHALGVPPADVPEDTVERQALYRSVLARQRVLLMLDDAASEEQVRPLVPGARGCLVLVTSRPRLAGVTPTATCYLDLLDDDTALALLANAAGDQRVRAESEAAREVVTQCGHLPLAVRAAGARLRARPSWTVAAMAERLQDEKTRLDELEAGDRDVRASFALSYDGLDPLAARVFRRLGLLDPVDFGVGTAAALLGGRAWYAEAAAALERLADAQLLESVGPRQYRLHDLLRLFAAERLRAEVPREERLTVARRVFEYYLRRTTEAGESPSGVPPTPWPAGEGPYAGASQGSPGTGRGGSATDFGAPPSHLGPAGSAYTPARSPYGLPGQPAPSSGSPAWLERHRDAVVSAVRRAAAMGEHETAWQLALSVAPFLESRGYRVDLATVAQVAADAARAAGRQQQLAAALHELGRARQLLGDDALAAEAFEGSAMAYDSLSSSRPAADTRTRPYDAFPGAEQPE